MARLRNWMDAHDWSHAVVALLIVATAEAAADAFARWAA